MTMERKRKNPPRGVARVEQVAKRRTTTPPERSSTPASVAPPAPEPAPEPVVEEAPLPRSVQAGQPLPTVEKPQPDDLPSKEYQSIQESGVLVESLTRSRQKWINEGIFEKYWTKPVKRKGVIKEEPNNPPKDSMLKIGNVIITIEPHVIEATMYGVKDPKPPASNANPNFRPVMQYGPPNGVMPPPPKPATPAPATPSTPSAVPASQSPAAPTPTQPATQQPPVPRGPSQPPTPSQLQAPSQASEPPRLPPSTLTPSKATVASPRGLESVLAAPVPPPGCPRWQNRQSLASPVNVSAQPGGQKPLHAPSPSSQTTVGVQKPPTPTPKPAAPAASPDPIIITLAERASEQPYLRDVMKRVAVGEATPEELRHFQKVIEQITAEHKKKGGQKGPSADRLLVDKRTVKYFADEVRAILDIVLTSNPNQKASDLRPPPGSDPLVILLVKRALEDHTTRNMVRRVAEDKTKFSDATDLKAILDKLKDLVPKDAPKPQVPPPQQNQPSPAGDALTNGTPVRKSSVASSTPATPASQQALRSKGPPPVLKADISAIVLEFSNGTGDRYLFPKYSILEYHPERSQLLASFLIVRKGSKCEYGGDPALDYYQPITIRITSPSGKYLENLARIVAPQDEVRRYMDDIMDNMTRAEYILLAMRLPRHEKDAQTDERSETPKWDGAHPQHQQQLPPQAQPPGVLWATKNPSKLVPQPPTGKVLGEEEQYQNFIATIS
ncbi:hypothetical protein BX600DRAFT_430606 [Xylariales sp. PMI_506]|nr:hypothetical protein BX600DRAFT_430606 [Xylariales sp. PMI_506]